MKRTDVKKRKPVFLITIFLLAIWLPLIFSDKQGGKVSNVENRYLATFPKFYQTNGTVNQNIIGDFDNWISDNTGGREKFSEINELLSYKIFNEFPLKNNNVVPGKNGWLYLLQPSEIKKYQNFDTPSAAQINQYKTQMTDMTRYLNNMSISYFVMQWPSEANMYPENMADTIKRSDHKLAVRILADAFKNNKNFNFSVPFGELQAAKAKQQVYYKAFDLGHWNHYGAFVGYQAMMQQVKKYIPNIKILNENDVNFTPVTKTLNVPGYNFSEKDCSIEPKDGWHSAEDQQYFSRIGFKSLDSSRNYYYYKNKDSSLPKALIVGDSFTWRYNLPLISESFSEVAFIHYADMGNFKFMLDTFSPDIVIECSMEGTLDALLSYNIPAAAASSIESLPQKAQKKMTFALGTVGNQSVKSMQMKVDTRQEATELSGWAVDELTQKLAKAVYIKIGNKFIKASYGTPNPSVSNYFHNKALENSGFTAKVNTKDMLEAGGFSVYVLSNDGSYSYAPVTWEIKGK